ncbi:CaiB/BaiF CoA-transferase family protein [uncultured Neptuniibacter sp.]|uniref:CaiB/BaiF CoA transferase family protein n=1 Tax=uncultured Neptuniibacter sp. TaxID=502143 RepID=UPI002604F1E7|nr:CaiB/BaiF CoA-transferase family protein [uncultured Neptuniibacter sp.]
MKPLSGLKVLDFSTLLPGPYATMLMADLGAEIVRVESPTRDDLVRNMRPQIDGQSAAFRYLNRGKESIALDLKHPESAQVIYKLLEEFDIVLEQFRPGVMARLGLGYEQLKAVKPDLIYCSVTGFGQSGDYADRAGHDLNFLALSGVASHMGRASQGPCPLGVQVADIASGSHPAVIAMLAAVIRRDRQGVGSQIDISMTDNSLALQALLAPGALNGGEQPTYESHFLNGGGFYDYYRTQDDRYLAVGSLEPQFKQRLLETLGATELACLDDMTLKLRLQAIFITEPLEVWQQRFANVDACVEPVLTIAEAADHPVFTSREMIQQGESGELQVASALRFDQQVTPLAKSAPLRGENTDTLLTRAGLAESEISKLRDAGVFG